MGYHEDLLIRLTNSDQWPQFENGDYLADLFEIADDAFDKKTIEGYLASTLIYHQLTEEFILLLLAKSNFLIQCSVFPAEIHPKQPKNLMFGAILHEFKKSVKFGQTEELEELCIKLNKIRINLVHKLAKSGSLESTIKLASEIKNIFGRIAFLFSELDDQFDEALGQHKKSSEDLESLYNQIKHSKNEL